jgi:hypothetical protein
MTDYTLTITSLVTTKFVDGEDPAAHIAKMKGFHHDLMLMNRDLNDSLFVCFLCISMPLTWNYVFAGLPQTYTSAEVEHRIKDEHGIKTNQESVAMAYRATQTNGKLHEHSHAHNTGDPYCTNCNKPGHWITGCWSKGGGAEGKGPRQKERQKQKSDEKDKKKKRGKDCTNQAVKDDSDSESHASDATYMATPSTYSSHSRYQWVLNSGSTTHICNNKSAFSNLILVHSTIGSIVKNGPQLDVHGCSDVHVICSIDGHDEKVITLHDVTFCPNARDNLISESRMDRKGMDIRKRNGKVTIRKPGSETVMQGSLQGATNCSLYIMDYTIAPPPSYPGDTAFSARYEQSLDLWHR